MIDQNITVNTICKFDGICWDDQNRKHIDYESYLNNPKNQNSVFSIEIGIKKPRTRFNIPINTINIELHFYKFYDDWQIKSESVEYDCLDFESDRQFNDFIYDNNIIRYIKDELAFWCGIYDDKIIDTIYNTISKELRD